MLDEIDAPVAAKPARSEARMKVLLTGELRSGRGAVGCRILDISRGGACIDADQGHRTGESVTFERGGLKVDGRVAWSRGKRIGIRFDAPIRATELLVQMSHSRTAPSAGASQPASAGATSLFPSR